MSCTTEPHTNRPTKRSKHEKIPGPKLRKPSRKTLYRIRYYEFKIRISDFCLRILKFLNRLTFRDGENEARDEASITPHDEDQTTDNINQNCARCTDYEPRCDNYICDTGTNKTASRQTRLPYKVHAKANSNRHALPVRVENDEEDNTFKKKRRSSFTRNLSPSMEGQVSVRKKSIGSGDTAAGFTDSDLEIKKANKLELKKNRRRDKKASKSLSIKSISEKKIVPFEKSASVSTQTQDLDNKEETIETTELSNTLNEAPSESGTSKFPPVYNNMHLKKAFRVAESTATSRKKTFWEHVANVASLSNRKRPKYLTESKPKVFQFGIQMDLPQGIIHRRDSIRSKKSSPGSGVPKVGGGRNEYLNTTPISNSIPFRYGTSPTTWHNYTPLASTKETFNNLSTSSYKIMHALPSFSSHDGATSTASSTLLAPLQGSAVKSSNPSTMQSTIGGFKDMLNSLVSSQSESRSTYPLNSESPTIKNKLTTSRSSFEVPKNANSDSVTVAAYKPTTQFTAQFYNLLTQNPSV